MPYIHFPVRKLPKRKYFIVKCKKYAITSISTSQEVILYLQLYLYLFLIYVHIYVYLYRPMSAHSNIDILEKREIDV